MRHDVGQGLPERRVLGRERLGALGQLARDREDRPFLRLADGRVPASAAARRAGSAAASTGSAGERLQAPRTSCERMTPEFPRAPMRQRA